MKTLIINGSPRISGDTASLVNLIVKNLKGKIIVVSAFNDNIGSCTDCRVCWKMKGCVISDDMDKVYDDSYDNVIIASPIYDGNLPAPMIAIQSRFNYLYNNRKNLGIVNQRKDKNGAIILVAGGDNNPNVNEVSLITAKNILQRVKAKVTDENIIMYRNTDVLPAIEDKETREKINMLIKSLNSRREV